MKNIIFILALTSLLFSCNESEDLLTASAKEGAILDITGSSAFLAGSTTLGLDITESEVQFLSANMTYKVALIGNSGGDVDRLIITKTYNGQTVKVTESDGGINGSVIVRYVSSSDFSNGFDGVESSDFRIGDIISFETTIVMNDESEYVYPESDLNVSINCLSDLTGTYSVTNTVCDLSIYSSSKAEITQNPDGTWYLNNHADGGFFWFCAGGHYQKNWGNITEQCGVILPSGDLLWGLDNGPYGIGDIQEGTWDAKSGTITMHHTQTFTSNWPSEWTSTYIRQ